MKKLIVFLLFLFSSGCGNQHEIADDEIYLFYSESCPHCHDAMAYIKANHAERKIIKIDIATPDGYALFIKCAQKFNLGKRIGTPLFCMGDNYLMGWSPEYEALFDKYVSGK